MRSSHQPVARIAVDPGPRRVPVVVDVVVVEDHRRSAPSRAASGCAAPTTTRGTAACTPRSSRSSRPAAPRDRGARGCTRARRARPRRRRPGRRAARARAATSPGRRAAHVVGEHAQRVDLAARRGSSSLRSECGGSCGAQTRQEPQAIRNGPSSPCVRMTLGGYGASGLGPDALAVEPHLVGRRRRRARARCSGRARSGGRRRRTCARVQPSTSTSHGAVGLDPDRRLVLARVAQERAEDQLRHQPASARSARTASISAGRSPVPSTVSEAVTAVEPPAQRGARVEVGVDRRLGRSCPSGGLDAARSGRARPSASRQSSRTACTAQRCVRVGCGSSSSAPSSQTMSSRAASAWNARATASTGRPVSLGDGDDVGRLHQLGRERVRPRDVLGHALRRPARRRSRAAARATRPSRSRAARRRAARTAPRRRAICSSSPPPASCARYQRAAASTSRSTPAISSVATRGRCRAAGSRRRPSARRRR